MAMTKAPFNPLALPYVSFRQPERLPSKPGVYFVVLDVRLKAGYRVPRVPHLSTGLLRAIAGGHGQSLCLYVGQSGDLAKRWSMSGSKSSHHKHQCIRVMATLLASFCDVGRLRIHYARVKAGKGLKGRLEGIEGVLIRQMGPPLNGLAPIARVVKGKETDRLRARLTSNVA